MNVKIDKKETFDKREALKALDRAIMNEQSTVHQKIFTHIVAYNPIPFTVNRFKEVARLTEGCSFGELALLKNEGRAATIICSKKTRFATL